MRPHLACAGIQSVPGCSTDTTASKGLGQRAALDHSFVVRAKRVTWFNILPVQGGAGTERLVRANVAASPASS